MRKFFLIPLVALFTCVNVWADGKVATVTVDNVTVAEPTSLTALNAVLDDDEIVPTTKTATVTLDQTIRITDAAGNITLKIPADKDVILNLAGKGIIQDWTLLGAVCTYELNTNGNTWAYTYGEAENMGLHHNPPTQEELKNLYQKGYSMMGNTLPGSMFVDATCGDAMDIKDNAIIFNQGKLRITSTGPAIVQINVRGDDAGNDKGATVICNDGELIVDDGVFIGPNGGYGLPKLPVIWAYSDKSDITINGGTFLCYEGISDHNKGANWGPIRGEGKWTIKGGIFSTDEMAGTPLEKTGDKPEHKSTKDWLTGSKAPYTGYTVIEVPYTNAQVDGYTVEYRHNQYYSYVKDNPTKNEEVGNQAATARANGDTIHNGICPDPVKMGGQDEWNRDYAKVYADRSTVQGSISYWVTADSARNKIYYQRYRYAVKPVCMVVPTNGNILNVTSSQSISGLVEKDYVNVAAGATLTIPAGATLKVGNAGVVLSDKTAKIQIMPGGTLISANDIVTAYNENIELTMDATDGTFGKYAHLLIQAGNIQAKHPNATVNLKSICKDLNVWQRFAIPTYMNNYKIKDIVRPAGVGTAFFEWQYDGEGDGNWSQFTTAEAILEPFRGYIMTNNATEAGKVYTFKGELVGNGNPTLTLREGWNYFANSYTAPIYVDKLLEGMLSNWASGHAAVWVQRNGKRNTWADIAYADVHDGSINPNWRLLQPMSSFVFKAKADPEPFELDYNTCVYNPLVNPGQNQAPRRAQAAQAEDYKMAVIVFTYEEEEEEEEELLRLYEGNEFSDSEDNGYDIPKLLNDGFNAYFVSPALGNLSRLASDNVENSSITLETAETTNFTLSFRNVSLEGYALKDNVADSLITISDEATYEFVAVANTKYEGRFTVVKTEDPTAVENVEDTKHITNGIYTVTGVYVGNNINMLPAGVYIINGKKVVK